MARRRSGQLIVTDARWAGRRVSVVIDTGSPVTIANPALLAAARRSPPSLGDSPIVAPDGGVLVADARRLGGLEIGGIMLNGVAVAIADAAPFSRFDVADTPALLLGMETLRLFRRVKIDFPGRSIRFTLPRDALPQRLAGTASHRKFARPRERLRRRPGLNRARGIAAVENARR